jgi:hypothetical protein
MNLTSYILEQALKQLKLPDSSLKQFRIASSLSDVGGDGFPKELFQLSAPLVVRGLLNFAVLQMNRSWVYPYWVHRQLDPSDVSFVPRSQNPLLLNVTHRNWTALGTPHGHHEAIVDPRGLATSLPREWSLDAWVVLNERLVLPSLSESVVQHLDTKAPRLVTTTEAGEVRLCVEHFVGSTNRSLDVLFQRARVINIDTAPVTGQLCIAIRPFNPEGVAPIHAIDFRHRRFAYVNNVLGVAFAKPPDHILCSNAEQGDIADLLRNTAPSNHADVLTKINCPQGLANAGAIYDFSLGVHEEYAVDCSVALASEPALRKRASKQTWRVSFGQRKEKHEAEWAKELSGAARFKFADEGLQRMFDASRLALLQLQDHDFISPGPYLYHHFWYRDSAPMVRALDLLGFSDRAREVIDAYPTRLTADGFFRGPEGEWDSNGTVLWSVHQHYLLTRSRAWLQNWYPQLLRGGNWITRKRRTSRRDSSRTPGMMPASLSAEHLGTVDQYFWDSFWSLAGLRSLVEIAQTLGKSKDEDALGGEYRSFEAQLRSIILDTGQRLGHEIIPCAPTRPFDESAIGSIASIYPLQILNDMQHVPNTLQEILCQFTDDKGFFHPMIHSGYNPYLTLQLAHSALYLGKNEQAWETAETIFRHMRAPYSLPEAIHPKTGGGVMGDGHHGWAAAEIVLFLRDCLVRESGGRLLLFQGANERMIRKGVNAWVTGAPTGFGKLNVELDFESDRRCILKFRNEFHSEAPPASVDITLPFRSRKVSASFPDHIIRCEIDETATSISCTSAVRTVFVEL